MTFIENLQGIVRDDVIQPGEQAISAELFNHYVAAACGGASISDIGETLFDYALQTTISDLASKFGVEDGEEVAIPKALVDCVVSAMMTGVIFGAAAANGISPP